ncbi:hypothetical protein [Arthrobacter sp. ERGS1:01]|uniref:hypothetical protein n=1 Tax=Arthrobacter sp. ERGS1:01 TaxID=1704044 RepID=UPI0012373226|nr:hypothetical protein [Arthrobacter sp. ERGS1:01]
MDQAVWSAQAAFQAAAVTADASKGADEDAIPAGIRSACLRATVVGAAEAVLSVAAHGMGPEPLAFEGAHLQRVADLELYLRQDHAERSLAAHGAALLALNPGGSPQESPW